MTIKLSRPFASNSAVADFDVRQMKKTLNRLGYYQPFDKTGITGISDADVFTALKEFQRDYNLPATGTAKPDDETIDALNREADKTPDGYYIWRTAEDGHVRASHAKLNRTVRKWSNSPDPGDDFNCRCWAEPVQSPVDSINDPPIEPVYPEMWLIPLLRAGKFVSLARHLYKYTSEEERWIINPARKQLQKKFKHAKVLGIRGNPNNKTLEEFRKALQDHIDDPNTRIIEGTYHKERVKHYYNDKTRINVIRNKDGDFNSVWELSDDQIYYMEDEAGKLGGGSK